MAREKAQPEELPEEAQPEAAPTVDREYTQKELMDALKSEVE